MNNSAYENLTDLIDVNLIESIYFRDKFKLNVEETLNLMKETSIFDFEGDIVLYGKDFKIIKISPEDERDSYFYLVSLKKPNKKKEYTPFTLNTYKFVYSDELSASVPFKTPKMLEQEEIEKKKRKEAKEQEEKTNWEIFIKDMEKFKEDNNSSETLTDEDFFKVFSGGKLNSCRYITIPKMPEGNYKNRFPIIRDENFLTYEDRKLFDFAGYAIKEKNNNFKIVSILNPYFSNEKYVNYFNEIIIELMKNKKIIPVIGVSPETFYTRSLAERPEGFMNRVKEDIIKYYS